MKIETKYNIGDHIWVVYEDRMSVGVYDEYITEIAIDKDNEIVYYAKNAEEIKENDAILYDETDKLVAKIQELMKEINERKEK